LDIFFLFQNPLQIFGCNLHRAVNAVGEIVVVIFEFIVFAVVPKLMETLTAGEGHEAVSVAVDNAGIAMILA
jgi:hypothetical protein